METQPSLDEVLEHWRQRLGQLQGCESLNEKGTVVRVRDLEGRSFVLKYIEHPERAGGIETQARLLGYLREQAVPVAPPIPTDAGLISLRHGGRVYTLSPHLAGGTFIAAGDLKRAHRNIGRALGRLHEALASYPYPIASWEMDLTSRVFAEAVPRVRERLDPPERERVERVLSGVEGPMRSAFSELPAQYIHGDCHLSNILLHGGEVSGFIDLDHLPHGPAIYDLGYLLADMVKRKVGSASAERQWRVLARQVLSGYAEVRSLSADERSGIWAIMIAVQLLFTEFFLHAENRAEAQVNLDAFYWLVERRKDVRALCMTSPAGGSDGVESARERVR